MASIYAKAERYKMLLSVMIGEMEPRCYFCGEIITGESLYRNKSGKKLDDFCWHHKNYNHYDDSKGNRVFAHRKCHLKHHREKEIREWKEKQTELYKQKLITQ